MSILEPDVLNKDFTQAHTGMKTFWDPFYEYERIARNRPHPKVVAAKLPTVTDGTLAGIIIAQPKRVVQRLPTGGLMSVDQPELAEIADFIWNNEIIPHATTNGDMLLKSWIMMSKALTYGMQFSYQFFRNYGDGFASDFKIPYIKDLIMERGKVYGPDCNILYLRQWYTPGDIKRIIDKEVKLTTKSKNRKDEQQYESAWDIPKLKKLLEEAKPKDPDALTPAESEKSPEAKFIQLVHALEQGTGNIFYTFSPDLPDGEGKNGNIVRQRPNKNPTGKMPISFLYADIDLSNPLGRGHVELSGAMQNMIDSEVQSYQLLQKIMLNPPVMKWGDNIRGATVKYKPNAVWDMGNDPSSKIEVVDINNEAIANFANNYGLMKSQILALTHNNESAVSANSGNTQSKTSAGVNQAQSVIGFDDNYMRRQFGYWFEDNAENMLNIHFAESDGKTEIELTQNFLDEQMPKMEQTPDQVKIDPEKKQAIVDYSEIKTKLRFRVDPTTAEDEDSETQLTNLKELLADTGANPYIYYYMLNDGYQLKLGEAYRDMFKRLGVEGIDKIVVKLPDDGSAQTEQLRGVMNPLYDKPSVSVPYIALPPSGQIQAAANAGITLTLDDVMGGPVLDPNIRGVENPVTDPNVQVAVPNPAFAGAGVGGVVTDNATPQPGQPPAPTAPVAPGQAAPAQIPPNAQQADQQNAQMPPATQPTTQVIPQALGGTAPNSGQPQPAPSPAAAMPAPHPSLKRNAVGGLMPADPAAQQAALTPPPPKQMPQPGQKMSPEDQAIAKALLKAGYGAQQVADALVLLAHGRDQQEVLQAIGPPQRGK